MQRVFLALCIGLVVGCASIPADVQEGKRMISQGRVEEGLAKLEQIARENPTNAQARSAYVMQQEALIASSLREADTARVVGDLDTAEASYKRIFRIDPGAKIARAGLDTVARDRRHVARVREAEAALKAGDLALAESIARAVLAENSSQRGARTIMRTVAEQRARNDVAGPVLKAGLTKPTSLEFREAPVRDVFEVLSRTAGINFIMDRDVRADLRTTIFVRDTSVEDIIKLVLLTNQLDRKVINENSVLVYPNTPAKQKEYQELVVRSFYVTNADVKQTAAMIRALVKTRDIFVDEKLNLLVMKDTPDAVRLAEQLVATQDLGEPEVMLELEVLEVASSLIEEFGVRYPDKVSLGLLGSGTETEVTNSSGTSTITTSAGSAPDTVALPVKEWRWFIANPALTVNLRKNDGSVNILANPRIRVKNREKAKIHIGEKVPVITTTSTANVGVSSSVSYLETGLKLDVEPNIYLEDDVAIKIQLEVSNILEQLNVGGTVSYRLGTRVAATTLRLRDGETQVLAGLINDEDRKATNSVPYLGAFPLLGRLFRNEADQRSKSEVVLLVTPRVVRNLTRPETVPVQFPSGTDAVPGAPPLRLAATGPRALSVAPAAAAAPPPSPAAAAPADNSLKVIFNAPPQAALGDEFVASVGVPAGKQDGYLTVELIYDSAVLNVTKLPPQITSPGGPLTSGAVAGPDRGRVDFVMEVPGVAGVAPPTAQVSFRVVAKAATQTEIEVNVIAVDNSGRGVTAVTPPPHHMEVVAPSSAPPPKPEN